MAKQPKKTAAVHRSKLNALAVTANAKAEASAKAELSAKLRVSRERKMTGKIPKDVTRAYASAWLGVFEPLVEAGGLVGAEIRHKAEARRLKHESTLADIVAKAKALRDPEKPILMLSDKFLIPFAAQASIEDADSPLIDAWAGLLASATEGSDPTHNHFISVISQLSSRQGECFKAIVSRSAGIHELEADWEGVQVYCLAPDIGRTLRRMWSGEIAWLGENRTNDEDYLSECLERLLVQPAIAIALVAVHVPGGDARPRTPEINDFDINFPTPYTDSTSVNFEILRTCGLLDNVNVQVDFGDGWEVDLDYYHLTTLGLRFASVCKILGLSLPDSQTNANR